MTTNDSTRKQGTMSDREPVTSHEVAYLRQAIEKLDRTIESLPEKFERMQDKIDATYVRKESFNHLADKVKTHGSYFTWATYLVLSAVIVAVVGLVISVPGVA